MLPTQRLGRFRRDLHSRRFMQNKKQVTVLMLGLFVFFTTATLIAQQQAGTQNAAPGITAAEDHQNMLKQLGIRKLRPGPSGNEQAPNHANYDEATANPFPKLPEVLTLKNGKKVTTAALWSQRRAEIVEDFEREVLG